MHCLASEASLSNKAVNNGKKKKEMVTFETSVGGAEGREDSGREAILFRRVRLREHENNDTVSGTMKKQARHTVANKNVQRQSQHRCNET